MPATSNEKLPVKKEKPTEVVFNQEHISPFGNRVPKRVRLAEEMDYSHYVMTYGVGIDKDDPTRSKAVLKKQEKISEIVHAAAKDVGIDAVLRDVRCGKRTLDSLADQGDQGVDDTLTNGYYPEKVKDADALHQEALKSAATLGVDPSTINGSNFEELINKVVEQKIADLAAKKEGGDK